MQFSVISPKLVICQILHTESSATLYWNFLPTLKNRIKIQLNKLFYIHKKEWLEIYNKNLVSPGKITAKIYYFLKRKMFDVPFRTYTYSNLLNLQWVLLT